METLLRDLGYGARSLLATPVLTFIALLSLSLGIGLNTAVFSLVYPVFFQPLPFRDADRIVVVSATHQKRGYQWYPVAPVSFEQYRAEAGAFEDAIALKNWTATVSGEGRAVRYPGLLVTANFFQFLGVEAQSGRLLRPEDAAPDAPPVVVISDRFWKDRFGADPQAPGKTLTVDGKVYTIVGVMPEDFHFIQGSYRLMGPLIEKYDPVEYRYRFLAMFARLRPGGTPEQAEARLRVVLSRLAQQYPDTHAEWDVSVTPAQRFFIEQPKTDRSMAVFAAAAALVLFMACINVANLQLARAASREKEIAIRAALGASRGRVVRQLLTENVVLALAGGILAVGLTYLSLEPLRSLLPTVMFLPPESVGIHWPLLAFVLLVSLGTAVLSGLAPALRASSLRLNNSLREGGRTSGSGFRGRRWQSALVVVETSLAALVLLGAVQMYESYRRVLAIDPGFDSQNVLMLRVRLNDSKYPDDPAQVAFFREALRRLEELPEVVSTAAADILPLASFSGWFMDFKIQGRPAPPDGDWPTAVYRSVTPRYFETLRIPVLAGRVFDERDDAGAPGVVIIDRVMAERFWPEGDALGAHIHLGSVDPETRWLQVVGIVEDVEEWSFGTQVFGRPATTTPVVYQSFWQNPRTSMWLVARTRGDPNSLAQVAQETIWSIDPDEPITGVRSLEEYVYRATETPRTQAQTAALLAAGALLLALSGIHGVMAFSVSRRMHEMGIRLTLGARPLQVLRLVIIEALRLTAVGAVFGLAFAVAALRLLSGMLYGVSPTDPLAMAIVLGFLAAVAVLSSLLPAIRATRADPLQTLRAE